MFSLPSGYPTNIEKSQRIFHLHLLGLYRRSHWAIAPYYGRLDCIATHTLIDCSYTVDDVHLLFTYITNLIVTLTQFEKGSG